MRLELDAGIAVDPSKERSLLDLDVVKAASAELEKLRPYFADFGSAELHGCKVGQDVKILSALAGLMLVGRLDSAQPGAGVGYEFGAIAAVVLGGTSFSGGKGTLAGTILGVLIMGVLENGMNLLNVNPFSEQVVKGVVIAAALVAYGSLGRKSRTAG